LAKSVGKKRLAKGGWQRSVGKGRLARVGWPKSVGKKRLAKGGWQKAVGKKRLPELHNKLVILSGFIAKDPSLSSMPGAPYQCQPHFANRFLPTDFCQPALCQPISANRPSANRYTTNSRRAGQSLLDLRKRNSGEESPDSAG
jgi:hypothetical protein